MLVTSWQLLEKRPRDLSQAKRQMTQNLFFWLAEIRNCNSPFFVWMVNYEASDCLATPIPNMSSKDNLMATVLIF